MCVHHALSSKVWGGCNVLPSWIIDCGGLNSLTRAQAGDLGDSWLNWIIFLIMIAVLNIYGSRLQVQMWMNQIAKALTQLQQLTKEASNTFLQEASKFGGDGESVKQVLEEVKGFFTIQPVTLDPAGAIRRLENILDNAKDMLDRFVERAAPKADKVKRANLRDQLQGVIVLDLIFRIVRHFYLLGKKTQNWIYIAQVQMQLPEIMRIARAYWRSSAAFQKGVPVGDSVGPLVALRLIGSSPVHELAEDVVVGETEIESRRVIVVKARGPGGEVGKPGEAIKRIIESRGGKVAKIIMIDAAMKLEGEPTGEIAEGSGAAIGDPGPEKWKIEEAAAQYSIPIHAIVIKEDLLEAITPMAAEIAEAADKVVERVKRRVVEGTKPGDVVIVAGIGNTVGVGNTLGEVPEAA